MGIFALNDRTLFFAWLFTILNSFQVLVFHKLIACFTTVLCVFIVFRASLYFCFMWPSVKRYDVDLIVTYQVVVAMLALFSGN